jgi:hypothetical protein
MADDDKTQVNGIKTYWQTLKDLFSPSAEKTPMGKGTAESLKKRLLKRKQERDQLMEETKES